MTKVAWLGAGAVAVLAVVLWPRDVEDAGRKETPVPGKFEVREVTAEERRRDFERREREARSDALREKITEALLAGDSVSAELSMVAWFEVDPEAVEEWVAVQEEPEALDEGLSALAFHLGDHERRDEAVRWAERIENGNRRETTLRDIYALALRKREMTLEEVPLAELPEWVREDLMNGRGD